MNTHKNIPWCIPYTRYIRHRRDKKISETIFPSIFNVFHLISHCIVWQGKQEESKERETNIKKIKNKLGVYFHYSAHFK